MRNRSDRSNWSHGRYRRYHCKHTGSYWAHLDMANELPRAEPTRPLQPQVPQVPQLEKARARAKVKAKALEPPLVTRMVLPLAKLPLATPLLATPLLVTPLA